MYLPPACTHSYYARLPGAGSFAKYSAVRWNVCRPSYRYIHPGYIRGRGIDLMYPLGRVPTHPFRVLGFVERGKNEENNAYGGTRDELLGDADVQNAW